MCLATEEYFLGISLCNTSHRPLKAYIFIERLFDIELIIVEEETHHLNGTGKNVQI